MASDLSEEDLRAAAAEAGVSPHELRMALASRNSMADPSRSQALAGAGPRHVEARLPMRSDAALAAVRRAIETQIDKRGHAQGRHEADIVDDDAGLTYRLRARSDGDSALVRVDIDAAQARSTQALATTGILGISLTMLALGLLFGATVLWMGAIGLAALGALLLGRNALKLRSAVASAQATAAHALVEVEDKALTALPPATRSNEP